jgi:hypothetical protein
MTEGTRFPAKNAPATHKSGANSIVKAGIKMSKNSVSFVGAELAGLSIRTAKNGNKYASGVLILRNENGGFEASLPFLCFSNAVGALGILEQQEHSAELTGESGKPVRPIATVSGWFNTGKDKSGAFRKSATFRLESVDEIVEPAEDSSL